MRFNVLGCELGVVVSVRSIVNERDDKRCGYVPLYLCSHVFKVLDMNHFLISDFIPR